AQVLGLTPESSLSIGYTGGDGDSAVSIGRDIMLGGGDRRAVDCAIPVDFRTAVGGSNSGTSDSDRSVGGMLGGLVGARFGVASNPGIGGVFALLGTSAFRLQPLEGGTIFAPGS